MTATAEQRRARMIALCGWLILLLGFGALLLPQVARASGTLVVGELLLLAGLLELVAASGRHSARVPAALAALATMGAGILFLLREETRFLPNITVVTFWLGLRVVLLMLATAESHGSVRRWTGVAAATDLALAAILLLGLPLASIVVALFGTTSDLVASFSWVLAASFFATGAMLLQIASCAREGEA